LCSHRSEIVGTVAVIRDISAQRSDRQAHSQLSRVVEQTADVVVITNQDGVIDYVNPAFETVTGYSRDEAIGETPRLLRSAAQTETDPGAAPDSPAEALVAGPRSNINGAGKRRRVASGWGCSREFRSAPTGPNRTHVGSRRAVPGVH
jgi:PAS domain-containing protein